MKYLNFKILDPGFPGKKTNIFVKIPNNCKQLLIL